MEYLRQNGKFTGNLGTITKALGYNSPLIYLILKNGYNNY